MVHRAAKTALAPPTGPVFLSLPGDILKSEAELDLMAPTRVAPRLRGDRAAVEAAAAVLAQAKRPVIIAGDAVAQSRAHAELVELAELIGAPVYAEFVPNTASFPTSHPLFRGALVRTAPGHAAVLEQYDVLFSVGGDLFTLSLPSPVDPMPKELRLIHLDIDPWEIGKNYPPEVAILGDPKATLPELTAAVRERMSSGARGAARERLQAAGDASRADRENLVGKARALAAQSPIQPLALLTPSARCCRRTRWWWRRRCRRRPASASSSAATIRRAISACAAAASAGACRRRSASSSRCRTGRWSG